MDVQIKEKVQLLEITHLSNSIKFAANSDQILTNAKANSKTRVPNRVVYFTYILTPAYRSEIKFKLTAL
jgi:hypothetical protein